MKSTKILLIFLFTLAILFIIPNISKAAVEYTRQFPSNDGTIVVNLTGLTLDETKKHQYALTIKGDEPSKWLDLTDFTANTAKVKLGASTEGIVEVLEKTDKGYLYIKEESATTNIVDGLEIDLKLPYLQAVNYEKLSATYVINKTYDIGGFGYVYTQFQKIEDKNFIEKYVDIKNSNGDVSELERLLPNVPQFGYNKDDQPGYGKYNDGLYLLWVKLTGDGCKDIFGCILHDGKESATKVSDYITIEDKTDHEQPKSNDDETNNQDKSTELDKSTSDADKGSNNGSASNGTTTPKTDPEDSTTASKTLPKTGKGIGILISFAVITIIGVFAYLKYKNLNYVK